VTVRMNLYCRIGDANLGTLATEHPPRAGDLLLYRPPEWTGFESQQMWRVDAVAWQVAEPGSPWALDQIRAGRGLTLGQDGTVTPDVDVHLWPDRGPFGVEIPEWAKRILPEEEEADGE